MNDGSCRLVGNNGGIHLKKILIIEDDVVLSEELKRLLDNQGYDAHQLFDFSDVARKALEFHPDLILLDIILPGADGQFILRNIRKQSDVPVIMLTSKNTDMDEILSISSGADDYITKPYNPTLLLLRIEMLFTHLEKNRNQEWICYRNFRVNPLKSTLQYEDQEIILSKNEIAILSYLMKNHGKIVSRDDLMDHLWDSNHFVDDNTLTVNINRLRKRLAEIGICDLIQTRRKQGYILE